MTTRKLTYKKLTGDSAEMSNKKEEHIGKGKGRKPKHPREEHHPKCKKQANSQVCQRNKQKAKKKRASQK